MPDWPRSFPIGLIAFPAGNGKQMTDGGKTNNTLIGKRARRKGPGFDSRKYQPDEPLWPNRSRSSPATYLENRSGMVGGNWGGNSGRGDDRIKAALSGLA